MLYQTRTIEEKQEQQKQANIRTRPLIGEILVKNHVPYQYIDYALKEQKVRKKTLGQILVEESLVNPEVLAKAIAEQLGLKYFSIFTSSIQQGIEVDYDFVIQNEAIPIREEENYIEVGMVDPADINKKDNVDRYFKQKMQKKVIPVVISTETFSRYVESLSKIDEKEIVLRLSEDDSSSYDIYRQRNSSKAGEQKQEFESEHVSEALRLLLKKAIIEKVSDIHIEPTVEGGRIRFRKNGILSILTSLDRRQYVRLSNIIRITSNLDIVERHLPQDGRIDGAWLNDERYSAVDFRVSSLPNWGKSSLSDSIVIRILDRRTSVLPLNELGMNQAVLDFLNRVKHKSHGMIVFTGPTGSGKTTTIYSTMATINTIERSVVTVEDPVEYRNYLWKQVQINEKKRFTFARALRSILRHDPDIIFCGEIRDEESAKIAFDMANTGHLVFTTLHANNSVKAIPRMLSLGVTPAMIESSVLGVVAQRLVRVFCKCKGKGCMSCDYTGFRGRTMISEHFPITQETYGVLQKAIEGNVISAQAELSKITPNMEADVKEKIQQGLISKDEFEKVI